jgi:membrane protein YdbS with pleckstrin-like domain
MDSPARQPDVPSETSPAPGSTGGLEPIAAVPVQGPDDPGGPPSRLDRRVVQLWRMQRLLRLVLVVGPVATALGVGIATVAPATVGMVVAALLVSVQLLLALAWPPLEYGAFTYALRKDDLLVQSGVLFKRWSAIPFHRIQHVDTRQGPMERFFGISRLLVYTAAGVSADGSIPGLGAAQAERLRDELSRRGGDDGV